MSVSGDPRLSETSAIGSRRRSLLSVSVNDVVAVFVGLGLYVFFIVWAHLKLFGVAPMG